MEKVLTDKVLTDEEIYRSMMKVLTIEKVQYFNKKFARAIEQAVLNSEQVQTWKRDAECINAMEQKRILVTPEYEGGWHAEIYGDQEIPIVTGYGDSTRAAIDSAMENSK